MSTEYPRYILSLSCQESSGVLAQIAHLLDEVGAYVLDAKHFGDQSNCRFFFRTEIELRGQAKTYEELSSAFTPIAQKFDMRWELHAAQEKPKLVIFVSRKGHCLNELMYQWRNGLLPAEIVAVISNHQKYQEAVQWNGLPFHYLPVSKETKNEQEAEILKLLSSYQPDYLVLARYMQILSKNFCDHYPDRIINIHHSFLPGFKGAHPHQRAFERGVKMIGATSHFVIPDLDEGPIIEQDVKRVTHEHQVEDLKRLSQEIQRSVLSRAIHWLAERRVLVNDQRTVVF